MNHHTLRHAWHHQIQRLNQKTPRERAILCAAALALSYALADSVLLNTQFTRFRGATQKQGALLQESKMLQQQEQTLQMLLKSDPNTPLREQKKSIRQQLEIIEQQLGSMKSTLVQPGQIIPLLQELLKSHRSLKITGLRLLPPEPITDSKTTAPTAAVTADAKTTPSAASQPVALLWRHRIELTLAGNYLEILGYLEELEGLPWRFSWPQITIKAQDAAATTATVVIGTYSLNDTLIKL